MPFYFVTEETRLAFEEFLAAMKARAEQGTTSIYDAAEVYFDLIASYYASDERPHGFGASLCPDDRRNLMAAVIESILMDISDGLWL